MKKPKVGWHCRLVVPMLSSAVTPVLLLTCLTQGGHAAAGGGTRVQLYDVLCPSGSKYDWTAFRTATVAFQLRCADICVADDACLAINVIKMSAGEVMCQMFDEVYSALCVSDANAKALKRKEVVPCPPGFIRRTYTTCYQMPPGLYNHADGLAYCQGHSPLARYASVESEEDYNYIIGLKATHGPTCDDIHLAGVCASSCLNTANYYWDQPAGLVPVTFDYWGAGQPSHGDDGQLIAIWTGGVGFDDQWDWDKCVVCQFYGG